MDTLIRMQTLPLPVARSDPLDGLLDHRRVNPSIIFVSNNNFYKCCYFSGATRFQYSIFIFYSRPQQCSPPCQTRTARSGVEFTNHEATAPAVANQKEVALFQANQVSPRPFLLLELVICKFLLVRCYIFSPEISSVSTFVVQNSLEKHPTFLQVTKIYSF